jgi:hypothetical protein
VFLIRSLLLVAVLVVTMMEPALVGVEVLVVVHRVTLALVAQAIHQAHLLRKVLTAVVEQTQAHTLVAVVAVVAHQELLDHLGQDQQLEQVVQERLQVSQVRQLPTPVAVAQVLQMAEPAHQVEQVAAARVEIAVT